jgi:hypothetical protein
MKMYISKGWYNHFKSSIEKPFQDGKVYLYILIGFLSVSCGDIDNVLGDDTTESEPTPFQLWLEEDIDENGFYHKIYPRGSDSSYGRVYCLTLPTQRVFWSSPNSFDTYYQQQWFSTPIIQYSTYTSNDGTTQQLYYLYEQFIGDTLILVGGLSEDTWSYVSVIID